LKKIIDILTDGLKKVEAGIIKFPFKKVIELEQIQNSFDVIRNCKIGSVVCIVSGEDNE